MLSVDLLSNALVAGLLLGGFYAAVSIGLAISFGQLDIVNIAHPAFVVVGSYVAWILNSRFGLDPVLVGLLAAPLFFAAGVAIYRIYYAAFERTGQESLSGLAFFFGLMFIVEVGLMLAYGVDYRLVSAGYIGKSFNLGPVGLPLRLVVPFVAALALTGGIWLYLARTFTGRAILAVAQDPLALQLMGADPVRVKQFAFGLATATTALAGALLIVIGPVEPSVGREYIGRVFAIVVLGGMGSIGGMFVAALLLGIVESVVSTFAGPSWAPAVAFGVLLLTLALRPAGLFGRR
ncbi:MAG: branched-chain amino acid ABC transporter permease [Betaproteobacteria bacterium]|nr:branched-chain amino acid ABC transporter permease [Betaproteobacteria bacterium]